MAEKEIRDREKINRLCQKKERENKDLKPQEIKKKKVKILKQLRK